MQSQLVATKDDVQVPTVPLSGFRYLGSKERLLQFIEEKIFSTISSDDSEIGDLFAGTAAVSRLFKRHGKRITANDNLRCCFMFAQAALGINEEPSFTILLKDFGGHSVLKHRLFVTPYETVLDYLNSISGQEGFIYREYSPGGTSSAVHERLYFTDSNAQKIDAIRTQIFAWLHQGSIAEPEACLLLTDLMRAANRVANTSGTYGCFNKTWDSRAHKNINLEPSQIIPSKEKHTISCDDAMRVAKRGKFDVVYLDPPYTWRHYGAYYHILETIASGDEPNVVGRTGLRPWGHSKSRFADRSDASNALRDLFASIDARHIFLSYSSEGLITHDEIMTTIRSKGSVNCWEIGYRRFKSNGGGSSEKKVTERLYHVKVS